MKKTYIVLGIGLVLIALSLMACGDKDVEEETLKIGLSFDSFVVERWSRELEVLVSKANELGAEVIVQVANEDVEKQKEQIRYLISENIDVLIVVPNDVIALSDVITEAHDAGIKVISYDRLVKQSPIDLYISFDNVNTGVMMASRLMTEFDKTYMTDETSPDQDDIKETLLDEGVSNILIINGDPKDNNSAMLNQGFHEVIDPYIEAGKVKVVSEIWASGWREQYARDLVEKQMRSGVHIDGIIAGNDVLATGAIETLSKWQVAGQVYVVGQDAELSACQRIVEGTQLSTVYKDITILAETTIKLAIDMANGKVIETQDTINNGEVDAPYYKLQVKIVDSENLNPTIIDSGFHNKEDVYLNENIEESTGEEN